MSETSEALEQASNVGVGMEPNGAAQPEPLKLAGVSVDNYIPKAGDSIGLNHYVNTHLAQIWRLAEAFSRSGAVPTALRGKPYDTFTVLITGLELGIGYATALRSIDVVEGRAALSSSLMQGLAVQVGTSFRTIRNDNDACTIAWKRGDSEWNEVTFTMEDARKAGLLDKSATTGKVRKGWANWSKDMLYARAGARAARRAAPDRLAGLYSTEEMQDVAQQRESNNSGSDPVSTGTGAASHGGGAESPQAGPASTPAPNGGAEKPKASRRTKATAPEVAAEKDAERAAAAAGLWAIVNEIGIGVKGDGKDVPSRITIAMPDLEHAATRAGLGDKLHDSVLPGGGKFLVPRELDTAAWIRLTQHLRETKKLWDAEQRDEEAEFDAAEMVGATASNPADPAE